MAHLFSYKSKPEVPIQPQKMTDEELDSKIVERLKESLAWNVTRVTPYYFDRDATLVLAYEIRKLRKFLENKNERS